MSSQRTPGQTPSPTTTYPFSTTIYSTSLSSTTFTTPTAIPSIFSFAPGISCAASPGATPLPSNYPRGQPWGVKAACMISNDRNINPHAFWDLYACCKGLNITASGIDITTDNHFNACTAECSVGDEQTWQNLGECLSKRVEVVVCQPRFSEVGRNDTSEGTRSRTTGQSGTGVSGSGSGSMSATAQVSPSTGAGNMNAVAHVGGSKAGAVMFVLLAMGSFAGMML